MYSWVLRSMQIARLVLTAKSAVDVALFLIRSTMRCDLASQLRVWLSYHKPFDCKNVWITSYAPVAL